MVKNKSTNVGFPLNRIQRRETKSNDGDWVSKLGKENKTGIIQEEGMSWAERNVILYKERWVFHEDGTWSIYQLLLSNRLPCNLWLRTGVTYLIHDSEGWQFHWALLGGCSGLMHVSVVSRHSAGLAAFELEQQG